ncbi:porin family protein [Desertivirga xinjiangensis]|uniref:porin family protein n=1 Tax=Desertivirga xinjiangensis TaxID=539206 RepID=UPI00210CB0C5|nr:porin family protein [Pedobacter xinjiangensis]
MKKLITTTVILLTAFAVRAQLPSFDLGLKAGVNLATLQADWASTENRLGYQVGAWARVGGAGFYVQPEVYLGSKGGKFGNIDADGTTVSGSGKVNFTTLDIPVLLGNKIGMDKLNIRFMAGPIVSFILKNDFEENYNMGTNVNDYKNQTIGAQLGAGVDVGNISVDLRYEKGLSNIEKSGKYDQKQNLWHLSLGYKLF